MKSLHRFSDFSYGLKKLVRREGSGVWLSPVPAECKLLHTSVQLPTSNLHQDHWGPVNMDSQVLPRFTSQRSGSEPEVTRLTGSQVSALNNPSICPKLAL